MSFNCKNCNSEDIRSLQLIYEEGLNTIDSKAKSHVKGTFISSQQKGQSQSALSKKCSPPTGRNILLEIFLFFIVFLVTYFLGIDYDNNALAKTVSTILFWLMIISAIYYNSTTHRKNYKRWKNSYLCNKCGSISEIV